MNWADSVSPSSLEINYIYSMCPHTAAIKAADHCQHLPLRLNYYYTNLWDLVERIRADLWGHS